LFGTRSAVSRIPVTTANQTASPAPAPTTRNTRIRRDSGEFFSPWSIACRAKAARSEPASEKKTPVRAGLRNLSNPGMYSIISLWRKKLLPRANRSVTTATPQKNATWRFFRMSRAEITTRIRGRMPI
jgi:hypothetical protein